ncbi:MAG: hydroxymethylglutaryl-CoA lyase [Planctomycetota bacterium]|nr:hydroxymethylglutaryl-CoA lyase [Planctomycetota bacterium]
MSPVRITDVAPRDGLQNEPGIISVEDKLALVESLALSGVDEVEVTSFVSPKWVPQLADAEAVLAGVREFCDGVRQVAGGMPTRAQGGRVLPVFSVLAPNGKGFERALAVHEGGLPLKLALFTAASETFNRKNTNSSIAESVERFGALLPRAVAAGMPVRMYVSCAVACPFEGAIEPGQVRRVVEMLLALAASDAERRALEVDLGDTIGVATPQQIVALLGSFERGFVESQVTLHLHDTFGRATECVRAGLGCGVRSFDGAAGGLGGCPYASTPERRAPGNIATEALVRTVHAAGFRTEVDEEALAQAGALARRLSTPSRAARPGEVDR